MKQVVTRVEDAEYERFKELTASLGTTAADAVRIFVHSFNDHGGFPYPVRKRGARYVDFEDESEVDELMDALASEVMDDETW